MMRSRWVVLVGCMIALATSFGPAYLFTFAVFLKPVIQEMHLSRTQASEGFSVAVFAAVLTSTGAGIWIDRVGNRVVIIAAAIFLPVAMTCVALAHSFTSLAIAAFIVGAVGGASNPATIISLLPQWFDRRLGLALAIASSGIGLGGAFFPLAAQHFVQQLGWRYAVVAVAAIVALVGVPNAVLLVHDNRSFRKARRFDDHDDLPDDLSMGPSFGEVIRDRVYWRIAGSLSIVAMVYWGVSAHLAAIMTDRGFSPSIAALAVSASSVASLILRLLCGVLLDYVSAQTIGMIFFLGEALGCFLLATGWPGFAPYAAAFLLGAALGADSDILAFTLRRRFGMQSHAAVYAFTYALFNVGALLGPVLMGYTFDTFGSYQTALLFLGMLAAVAALIFSTVPQIRREWAVSNF